ncbi:MAG TPA: hypothetical protein VM260_05795, partial [Pirellula sp.]|nr:hypothetical protein [Pirellula sp.]
VEWSLWTNQRIADALDQQRETPWLAVPQWASKRIRLSNLRLCIIFACSLWVYVTNLAPLLIGLEWSSPKWMIGIGIYCISMATYRYWRTWSWNSAELQLATLPGVIGGPFSAAFLIRKRFPPDSIFEASLRCTYRIPSDGDSSHDEKTHWSSTIEIKAIPSSGNGVTAVPLSFAIPFQCPSSQLIDEPTRERDHVRWTLKVRRKNLFSTAVSTFVVPVYRTSDSQIDYEPDEMLLAPFQVPAIVGIHSFIEYFLWSCTFRIRDQQLEVAWGIRGLQKRWTVPRDTTTILFGKLMTRSEVAEFWDLFLRSPEGKSFVLIKAFSRSEIETIQNWLGSELGIGIEKMAIA